jgi:Zn-dependent protease
VRTIAFRVGSIWGVPISIDLMWFVTLIFVSGVCATIFPKVPILGFVMAVSMYASVLAHELAHVAVAEQHGVRTKEILLGLFGGTAIMDEEHKDTAVIAVAGPLLSIAIGVACGLATIWLLLRHPGTLMTSYPVLFIAVFATWNIGFALFNLLPVYPLDGGRILQATLIKRTGSKLLAIKAASIITVVFASVMALSGIYQVVRSHTVGPLFRLGMGLYLVTQAIGSYRSEKRKSNQRDDTPPHA